MQEAAWIDPQRLRETYERTGLRPMRYSMYREEDGQGYACGIGAYLAGVYDVRFVAAAKQTVSEHMRALGFDEAYRLGYMDGFDGQDCAVNAPRYMEGYRDGQDGWRAVAALEVWR